MSDKLLGLAGDSAVGGFSLFLGEAFSTLMLAAGLILVARLLGPDGYGLYTLAFVVPIFVMFLVELGVDEAVIRFPAQSMSQGNERVALRIVRRGLKFKFLVASAGSLVVFLLSGVLASYVLRRPELGFYLRIASVGVLVQAVFNSSTCALIGLNRMAKSAIVKGVMSFMRATCAPIIIILGFGVTGAITGYLLGFLAAVLLALILLFTELTGTPATTNSDGEQEAATIRTMVGYGFPVYLASLLGVLISQLQFVVLAQYRSNLEIGNFDAALNFANLIKVIALPVVLATFPAFSKLSPLGEAADLRRLFAASTKYASLIILPASAGLIVLSRELVYVVYGSGYLLAPVFLSLYSVSFLFAGIGSVVLGSFFNGIGETKSNLEIGVINTVIFFLAALLLTPIYGTLGLIAAFLASGLISLLFGLYAARRKHGVGLYAGAQARIFLATALPAIFCFGFLRISSLSPLLNLVLGATILTAAYLTLVPVFGAITADDIQNLTMLFRRVRLAWPLMKRVLAYEAELLRLLGRPCR